MITYPISELMLPTLIQRYDKKIISVLIQFKNKKLTEILQAVRCHILWSLFILIAYIILLNLSWIIKLSPLSKEVENLPSVSGPFKLHIGVYSNRREFVPEGSKFFSFREDPFQKRRNLFWVSVPDYVHIPLTLYMLGKNFSSQHFEIFFLFLLENRIWHFMQIVSKSSNPIF